MGELHISSLLWVVAYQMGLYALLWGLCSAQLRESRGAVAHWGLFMLLLALSLTLAGQRGEPREWITYNGTNLITVLAFATMRRGTEEFMNLPRHDLEQIATLLPALALIAAVGPGEDRASLRIVSAYAAQALIVLRTMMTIRPALADEFGRFAMRCLVIPGALISVTMAALAIRQAVHWHQALEIQRETSANVGLMLIYLTGSAVFSFGFIALVTQRLTARLRDASMRDPLTNLYNRRAMTEALERLWALQRRGGTPLAVLLIDIDHFKRINDQHGHAAGDKALIRVARLLQAHLRTEDVAGRIGGEEFLLLLPNAQAEQARALAERLRKLTHADPMGTTVSIGIALARADDLAAQLLVQRADAALYKAKAAGRDRIEMAE
ncbi:MAG: GGDEF domain-containing protein [Burkholderiales bacterium]|nr:GGDEF domain-containing protein [Burkholderiales bacterium]